MRVLSIALLTLAGVRVATGQSDVLAAHKFAWQENVGWLNWRDAGDPDGAQGAVLHDTFLAGYVWMENAGWITLGDGSPADGSSYGNTDGADCGVNLDPFTGELSGMAWGENIGWINMRGGALADPAQPARLDPDEYRLRGYAWGENVGWLNLDDIEHYVAFVCPADFNGDGAVDTRDVLDFLNAWTARDPGADCDGNGLIDTRDVLCYLNVWTSGC